MRQFLAVLVILVAGAGCSSLHDSRSNIGEQIPVSHTVAAEQALDNALTNLSMPPGNGESLCWEHKGKDTLSLLSVHGAEYLTGRGYRLTSMDAAGLQCVMHLDSLFIAIDDNADDGSVTRSAEARLTAELKSADGGKRVFRSSGTFEDTFDHRFLDALDNEHPLLKKREGLVSILKPLIYGVTVTALVWFLYSYRG